MALKLYRIKIKENEKSAMKKTTLIISGLLWTGVANAADPNFNSFDPNFNQPQAGASVDNFNNFQTDFNSQNQFEAPVQQGFQSAEEAKKEAERIEKETKVQEEILHYEMEKANAKKFTANVKEVNLINYIKTLATENGYKVLYRLDKIATVNNNEDLDDVQVDLAKNDFEKQHGWKEHLVLSTKLLNNLNYFSKIDPDYIIPVIDEDKKIIYITQQKYTQGMRGKVLDVFEDKAVYKGYKSSLEDGYEYEKDGKKYRVVDGYLKEVEEK